MTTNYELSKAALADLFTREGIRVVPLSGKMFWPAGVDPAKLTASQRANIAFRTTMAERRRPAKLAALAAEVAKLGNDFSERLSKLETQ